MLQKMDIKRVLKDRISDGIFAYRNLVRASLLKKGNCRILMYHSIKDSNPKEDKMGLAASAETFYMHMKYLKENEFHVIALPEFVEKIANGLPIPEKSIVITFDDGFKGVKTYALPILKTFNFTATLFVNIYFVEKRLSGHLYWHSWQTLNWDEIRQLYEAGISIGSHAVTHNRLTELDEEQLKNEIVGSRDLIEKNINNKISTFSYPHGAFSNKVKEILKDNNFLCSCSSIEGTNGSHSDIFALRRTEITLFDDTPFKFEKKISGSYDWLRFVRSND